MASRRTADTAHTFRGEDLSADDEDGTSRRGPYVVLSPRERLLGGLPKGVYQQAFPVPSVKVPGGRLCLLSAMYCFASL